ncbi:MAG: hypothetical protein LBR62_01710 [Puniceicoccales bacterium]|jgi:hypothetical protein|nr:hypothetical protein [Puniceicoccales bacterium]
MSKNVEDIKKEFDNFINSYTKSPRSKWMGMLEPFLQHIHKGLSMGVSKRRMYEFLLTQKMDMKFSTFCSLLRQKNLVKRRKSGGHKE